MTRYIKYIAICITAVLLYCRYADAGERKTHYEGSVSAGASFERNFGYGASLYTSHGVRFNKDELRFLYLGGSIEALWMQKISPQIPLLLQFHAKANFPTDSRIQIFVGCEAGVLMPLPFSLAAPNFSPSIGLEWLIKDRWAVNITIKTYANPESPFGHWWTAALGFRF